MVQQSGTIHDQHNDTKKDHYVIRHHIDINDDDKLKDKETIIYKKPTLINQPFEHSLSSSETDDALSVSRSDIEFGTGTDTDDDDNSETSIDSSSSSLLPLPSNTLYTIMEEHEER